MRLLVLWSLHIHKHMLIHPMPHLPVQYRPKITALMRDIKIRPGVIDSIGPDMRIHVRISMTQDILQKHVNAMREMISMFRVCIVEPSRIFRPVVILEVRLSAQGVQAVKLVQHVDAARVDVVAETELRAQFHGFGGVFADGEDVCARKWDRTRVGDDAPCSIDFGAGFLSEDAGECTGEEACVHVFGGEEGRFSG